MDVVEKMRERILDVQEHYIKKIDKPEKPENRGKEILKSLMN